MATVSQLGTVHEDAEASRPPFLRRLSIRGYKSITFCDVTLEPLTILVGRNASGKSNFLDALAFLRDALDDGVNSAFQKHGGMAIFSRSTKTHHLAFEIEANFSSYQIACRAVYRIELKLTQHKQLEVFHENLELEDLAKDRRCGFTAAARRVSWHGLEFFPEGHMQRMPNEPEAVDAVQSTYPALFRPYQSDRLLLGVIGTQPFIDFAEGIRSFGCFNFHPDAMRELQRGVGNPALKRDGRNLARTIDGLKEIEPENLSRVTAYLRSIVPEIESFDTVQLGDYETVRFRVLASPGSKPLEFDAASMSDGTLRVLATLMAASQIMLPYGYPSLVAIEEPETSLHPAAMRALVDALDEATLRTQILLTTHSAEMLDNPTIHPENIRAVQMIDGQTVIGPVDEASVEIVRRKLDTLGGLERQNQLQPDPDDQDRQRLLCAEGRELKV